MGGIYFATPTFIDLLIKSPIVRRYNSATEEYVISKCNITHRCKTM